MNRDNATAQPPCEARSVPLVLAFIAHGRLPERDALLAALARSCSRRGGRVLILGREISRPGRAGIPGVDSVVLEGDDPAVICAGVDQLAGTPPRYDLVLLDVREDDESGRLLASLAQRVVIVATSEQGNLQGAREQILRLVEGHGQRHFSLAVAGSRRVAREAYRELLGNSPVLSRIDCDLLELPAGLAVASPDAEVVDEILKTFWGEIFPRHPSGSLQLFWRCVLFCSDCSLQLCRDMLSAGRSLEVCPIQRF